MLSTHPRFPVSPQLTPAQLQLKLILPLAIFLALSPQIHAQECYWQQHVAYVMDIDFDDAKHQFSGKQSIQYTNHSPDTLERVFYHLYFNAFQPGSVMDVRSRTIADPDPRIGARIASLKPDEIGYHHIGSLKQDGKKLDMNIVGTVAEVKLQMPLLPGETTQLDMEFESQVPIQIRRSGRNNQEGVDYTMTQWYPKLAEYDQDGWHTSPYVAREFHGVFGNFEVNINIPSSYTLAGTGVVQNPEEVGHGYARTQPTGERVTWKFKAENVHDFAWAADKEYRHITTALENGTTIHFFHIEDSTLNLQWDKLVGFTVGMFNIMNDRFGTYPYEQFSVIQAGDGGMEYPMCTMITSGGSFGGLVSVTVHEAIHNWFYGVLASNETKYPWMDEGFTTYAQNIVLDSLFHRGKSNPHQRSYTGYIRSTKEGSDEPLSTEADLYETNKDYGANAYSKGCVFLHQLSHIIGQEKFDHAMKTYFNQWKFKHPTPLDFKRIMEKASDMDLDWYFDTWIGTTKTIDYGIHKISSVGKKTVIELERMGAMPMPVELLVEHNGKKDIYYIPLQVLRNEKPTPQGWKGQWYTQTDWPWAYPYYELTVNVPIEEITLLRLDPFEKVADVNDKNDQYPTGSLIFRED